MPSRWLPQASHRPARDDSPSPKTAFSAATRISQLPPTRRPSTVAPECPRLATKQFQSCNPCKRGGRSTRSVLRHFSKRVPMTARSLSLSATRSFASSLTPETRHLIILVLVAIAIMGPLLLWGVPSNNDLSNHFRFALPFYDTLRSGHFY